MTKIINDDDESGCRDSARIY